VSNEVTIKILSANLHLSQCDILIENLLDCQGFAETVGKLATTPLAIALSGTLGAGKTQWTRFFATSLGATPETVSSPTFMLVHEYDSRPAIYHLDAYRIGDEDEMLELGIEEMFDANAITIVEWSDRFPRLLPKHTLHVHFEPADAPAARQVQLRGSGGRAASLVRELISRWT
jgi:tRNA threonylcarbamoyladenosine biosynthesis protein TsaE